MGDLGRKLGDRGLVPALTRACADEWFGCYNLRLASLAVLGHRAPDLSALLRRKSDAALARADRLAARLSQLGALPPERLGELPRRSTPKPFKLPEDRRDADAVLRAVLDAERTSLRTFDRLVLEAAGDAVTRRLAEELLAEAAAGEEELERLLGRPEPGLDGR